MRSAMAITRATISTVGRIQLPAGRSRRGALTGAHNEENDGADLGPCDRHLDGLLVPGIHADRLGGCSRNWISPCDCAALVIPGTLSDGIRNRGDHSAPSGRDFCSDSLSANE